MLRRDEDRNGLLCHGLHEMTADIEKGDYFPEGVLIQEVGAEMKSTACSAETAQAAAGFILAAGRKPEVFREAMDILLDVAIETPSSATAALAVRTATALWRENPKGANFRYYSHLN